MLRLCRLCGKRPAKFQYRGQIRADNDHDICLQCFRSISESNLQKEKAMKLFDAGNSRLSDAMFAEAYRATIPTMADATHVTVRACSARLAELSSTATDISDVVEIGMSSEKPPKMRVIAVPVSVHVDSGAAVIQDDSFDKHIVSFEVNGAPVVQIMNLALSTMEQKAEQAVKDAAEKLAAEAAKMSLDAKLSAAREQGKEEALLEQAKKEGAASVQKPEQGPQAPPTVQ